MATNDPKGSFVRWQSIAIGQLTYAANLILGLSIAALGFQITLLLPDRFRPSACQKYAFLLSMLLLALSIIFGLWLVINRLRDFRATETAARMREEGESGVKIEPYRVLYRRLGAITWRLFWWQVSTFGAGLFFTVLSVLLSSWNKLF
jgi:hypothetical protein